MHRSGERGLRRASEMDFGCSQMNANVGGVSASLNMLRMREMERVLAMMLTLPGNESACE